MIVEGQAHHCGKVARRLRTEYRDLLAAMKVNAHRDLRATYDESSFSRALVIDGKVVAIAGVTGPLASSDGSVWLAATEDSAAHPIAIARTALRHLNELLRTKRHLATIVLKADRTAMDFAYFLGFHVKETITIHGAEAAIMVIEQPRRMS